MAFIIAFREDSRRFFSSPRHRQQQQQKTNLSRRNNEAGNRRRWIGMSADKAKGICAIRWTEMCRNYEAREENDNRGFANSLTIELSLLPCWWWWWSKAQQLPQRTCRLFFSHFLLKAISNYFPNGKEKRKPQRQRWNMCRSRSGGEAGRPGPDKRDHSTRTMWNFFSPSKFHFLTIESSLTQNANVN